MEYIEKVDQRDLYGDGIGKVELWDFARANENEESRIEAVATVASICYGKPPQDAKKLVERLRTESGGLPSSAFEFIRSCYYHDISVSLRNNAKLQTDEEWCENDSVKPETMAEWQREVVATFKIKVPIFVARQVMRHRQFSYQELSRRYTADDQVALESWSPDIDLRILYTDLYNHAYKIYRALILDGKRPEIARAVLPVGLYTEFWMQGDAPAWENYFKLRLNKHAQPEHRELAQAMLDLLEKHQPELWEKVKL